LWGSKTTTDKGKQIEDFISQEGLCIFNDGIDTYLHPGNGSYSAIDLDITVSLNFKIGSVEFRIISV
jgi:hypothetical protein